MHTINDVYGIMEDNGLVLVCYKIGGEPATRIDADIYPVSHIDYDGDIHMSEFSTRYEHSCGILLTVEQAAEFGIAIE